MSLNNQSTNNQLKPTVMKNFELIAALSERRELVMRKVRYYKGLRQFRYRHPGKSRYARFMRTLPIYRRMLARKYR